MIIYFALRRASVWLMILALGCQQPGSRKNKSALPGVVQPGGDALPTNDGSTSQSPMTGTMRSIKLTMNGFQDSRVVLIDVVDETGRCIFQGNIDRYQRSLNGQYVFPNVIPNTGTYSINVWYDHDGNFLADTPTEKWKFDFSSGSVAELILTAAAGNGGSVAGNSGAGPVDFYVTNMPPDFIGNLAEMRVVDMENKRLVGAYVRPSLSYNGSAGSGSNNAVRGIFGCPSEGKQYAFQFWVDNISNNAFDPVEGNTCKDVILQRLLTVSRAGLSSNEQFKGTIDWNDSRCVVTDFPR